MFFIDSPSRIVLQAEMVPYIWYLMKYLHAKWMKLVLTAGFMILAGICYSCSRQNGEELVSGGEKTGKITLSEGSFGAAKGEERSRENDAESSGEIWSEAGSSGEIQSDNKNSGAFRPADEMEEDRSQAPDEKNVREEESSAPEAICIVYICGAVAHPGVYELPEGSRIYQAVEAAGGFLPEAKEQLLNLAAPVADGMKITVFTKEEADTVSEADVISVPALISSSGLTGEAGLDKGTGQININTAGKDELMTLKGIGESRAEDIIAYREKHGLFRKIEDIMKVPGIKDGAFQKIKDDITV